MYTALLTAMVLWISSNFDLPPDYKHPNITFVPASEIQFLRSRAFTAAHQREILSLQSASAAQTGRREAVAVYDDETDTIFLQDTWKGDSAADLSVLIHEMVHHLQSRGHIRYECGGAREAPAYAAQEKWLTLFGRSLESEFEIDPFTLKVSTMCGL
jgi:hypothetical protein